MEYTNLPGGTVNSALVGREAELEFLRERLEECLAGDGGTVAVSGEAGVGKTRLMDAVAEEAEKRRLQCWRSAADPARSEVAGSLFLGVLRALRSSGSQRQRQAMQKSVEELVPHLQEGLFLPAVRRRRRTVAGDLPSEWQLKLFCARLAHHLSEVAQSSPLVLCLEDLHWADAVSLQWLRYLCRKSGAAPLLILCTYRPEEILLQKRREDRLDLAGTMLDLCGSPHCQRLELKGLAEMETRALINSRLNRAELGEELLERLHRESGGVPLFVLQYLALLVEQGVLRENEQLWTEEQGAGTGVPDTVRAALWRRARGLSPEEQSLLGCAAVQGVEFKGKLVAQVLGRASTEVVRTLGRLARTTSLIHGCEGGFRFAHALLRSFFYEDLAEPERRAFHLQLARILERRQKKDVSRLAYHFSQAGAPALALPYLLAGAGEARAASDYRQARCLLRQGLDALERMVEEQEYPERRLGILLELAEIEGRQGEWNQAEVHCLEALRLWGPEAGEVSLGRAMLQLGRARCARGEWALAGRFYREALAGFSGSAPEGVGAQIQLEQGSIALERTLLKEARALLEEVRLWAMKSADIILQGEACLRLGQAAGMAGLNLEAILRCSEALRAFSKAGDKYGLCQTYCCLGTLLAAQGEWERALEYYTQSEVLARQMGAAGALAYVLLHQARVLADAGSGEAASSRWQAARVHLKRAADRRRQAEGVKVEGIICREMAKAAGAAELYRAAEARLQQARWAFGELENRFEEAECALELGMTLWVRGGAAEARQCWREASELFGQIGAAGGRARSEELLATSAA